MSSSYKVLLSWALSINCSNKVLIKTDNVTCTINDCMVNRTDSRSGLREREAVCDHWVRRAGASGRAGVLWLGARAARPGARAPAGHPSALSHCRRLSTKAAHVCTSQKIQSYTVNKDVKEFLNWNFHWLVNKFVIGIDPKYLKL